MEQKGKGWYAHGILKESLRKRNFVIVLSCKNGTWGREAVPEVKTEPLIRALFFYYQKWTEATMGKLLEIVGDWLRENWGSRQRGRSGSRIWRCGQNHHTTHTAGECGCATVGSIRVCSRLLQPKIVFSKY